MSTTPLHLAAFDGDLETVHRLLAEGADVNARTSENETALLFAAMCGHTDVVRILLKYGADVNLLPSEGASALRYAIRNGFAPLVRLLIANGADPEAVVPEKPISHEEWAKSREEIRQLFAKSQSGMAAFGIHEEGNILEDLLLETVEDAQKDITPQESGQFRCVMLAVQSKSLETLQVVLESGYSPNNSYSGASPLEMVRSLGTGLEMARLLLKYGANPNGNDGSPLQMATFAGDIEFARLLIEAGADPTRAAVGLLSTAIMRGNQEMITFLVERNIGLNEPGIDLFLNNLKRPEITAMIEEKRGTAWLAKVWAGDLEGVCVALASGADVNVVEKKGNTALMVAVEKGDIAMVRLLLESGATLASVSELGIAPLHRAASGGNTEILELLLECGADVHAENRWGQTPLFLAAIQSQQEAADLLITHGAELSVVEAILLKRLAVAETFWTTGTPVDYANDHGTTALHAAIYIADPDLIVSLLQHGANIEAMDRGGSTPLYLAVLHGKAEITRLLLEHGADPTKGTRASSPLATAVLHRNEPIVRLLLEHGAPIEQPISEEYRTEMEERLKDAATIKIALSQKKSENQLINSLFPLQRAEVEPSISEPIPLWRDANLLWLVVGTLIEFGMDVNVTDTDNNSLLISLIEFDAPMDMIQEVIARGAQVNATSQFQKVPLMAAIGKQRTELVEALLEAGANPNGGLTLESPLQIAQENGFAEIIALLEKYGASETKRQEMVDGLSETDSYLLRPVNPENKSPLANIPLLDLGKFAERMSSQRDAKIQARRQRLVDDLSAVALS